MTREKLFSICFWSLYTLELASLNVSSLTSDSLLTVHVDRVTIMNKLNLLHVSSSASISLNDIWSLQVCQFTDWIHSTMASH